MSSRQLRRKLETDLEIDVDEGEDATVVSPVRKNIMAYAFSSSEDESDSSSDDESSNDDEQLKVSKASPVSSSEKKGKQVKGKKFQRNKRR